MVGARRDHRSVEGELDSGGAGIVAGGDRGCGRVGHGALPPGCVGAVGSIGFACSSAVGAYIGTEVGDEDGVCSLAPSSDSAVVEVIS